MAFGTQRHLEKGSVMAAGHRRSWAGWIGFAGTMLLLVGGLNVFQGIVALLQGERVVADADNFVLVDLTSWGWTLIVSGALLIAIGAGLFAGTTWARVGGIVVVGLHAAVQVAWLGATPVWSLLMIALDTVVIFALTAHWSQAQEELWSYEDRADPGGRLPGEALLGQLPAGSPSVQRRVT
jgi:hypothetical protein